MQACRTQPLRSAVAGVMCAVALLLAWPVAADERIERFHVEVDVLADGSLEVTETIAVRAEGNEIRRGIVREFPTRYRDRYGNRVVVGFEMLDAQRNGAPEPFWTEDVANGVDIFLGDDSFLEVPQTHTYTLRYRTSRQVGFFDGFDELYWNVTGSGWIFPIDHASARVRLPRPVPVAEMSVEGYTGPQGATGAEYRAEVVAPGEARFETTQPLDAREGLTIVLGFPKGVVAEPTSADRAAWLLADNAGVLVALVGLLALLAGYLWQWQRKGRDPAPGVIFPRYEAPSGHSPGGLRMLRRMGWDDRCFTADLVDAAVHGALVIHRDTPDAASVLAQMPADVRKTVASGGVAQRLFEMALRSKKELWRLERSGGRDAPGLHEVQQRMLGSLFASSPVLLLHNSVPATVAAMQAARSAHRRVLTGNYKPAYFTGNGWVVAGGVLWTLLAMGLALVVSAGHGVPLIGLMAAIAVGLDILFAFLMKQPTAAGRRLLDEIEGLRLYLGVAERDELQRMAGPGAGEPELDAPRYEALLPYAMALGVEDAWTGKFTRAASAAAVAEAAQHASRWYRGDLARVGNLGEMSQSLSSGFATQISASSSPPGSSSGGGGGGSSGGGGGGGGGRGR